MLTDLNILIALIWFFDKYGVDDIKDKLVAFCDKHGYNRGNFFMVLRLGVAGSKVTPPIVETLPILGTDIVVNRLLKTLTYWISVK